MDISTQGVTQGQGQGLVRFRSNAEIDRAAQAARPLAPQSTTTLDELTSHVKKSWDAAKRHKIDIEMRLVRCLRMVKGEYEPLKLSQIRSAGGSEVYMMIAAQKSRDLKAWILDILQPAGDKPWTVDPTPMPDLPPVVQERLQASIMNVLGRVAEQYAAEKGIMPTPEEFNSVANQFHDEIQDAMRQILMDMAKKTSERMSAKIEDQLVEGNWLMAFREFVDDFSKFPSAILKGPILRKRKTIKWNKDFVSGTTTPKVEETIVKDFMRVSPFDIYPLPGTTDTQHGGLIERHRLHRSELQQLIGVPGYKDEAIRYVLSEYGRGGLREWLWTDTEQQNLHDQTSLNLTNLDQIDALQLWGSVQGRALISWGMEVPDPDIDYEIEAWLIGTTIIKAVLNPDKLGGKPYHKSSYLTEPDSFWGTAMCERIFTVCDVCNSTARAIVNNMAIASGPQVEVNVDKAEKGSDYKKLWPWKVWQTNDYNMTGTAAVRFHQTSLVADALIGIYDRFKKEADELTIPSYAHGDADIGGAGNTASGLSMLMSAATRGIKDVIWSIDVDIIQPVITKQYNFNMLYDSDESIKGDCQVRARGSSSLIAKEQLSLRRNEFLQTTNNPVDMAIIGMDGRRHMLKESAKSLEYPVDKVIPENSFASQITKQGVSTQVNQGQPEKAQETDLAGNLVAGQEAALFSGAKKPPVP